MFDERNTVEIIDPDDTELRYCVCKNPLTVENERTTRQRLIALTVEGLQEIAHYKKSSTTEVLSARVGRVLEKHKMGKFFTWEVLADRDQKKYSEHKLTWTIDQEKVKQEERLDGCYVIRTEVPSEKLSTDSVVGAYNSLGHVERAFRNNLKCAPAIIKRMIESERMLAYYRQWNVTQRLQPLFDSDGVGSEREWTFSCLKSRHQYTVLLKGVEFTRDGEWTEEQKRIVDLLGV